MRDDPSAGRPPPKIILLNRFFYPDESATSQLLTDLAFELVEQGRRVCVVTSRAQQNGAERLAKREQHRSIDINRVQTALSTSRSILARLVQYSSFYPGALLTLLRLAKKGDVIVAKTDPPLISVAAMIAARAKGAKLVNWVQDLYPEVAVELQTPFLNGLLGRALKFTRNTALSFASINVVIGVRMAERLRKLGIPAQKIEIVPNWADETAIRPIEAKDSVARKKWALGSGDFVVGYSGNLGRAHEVETLVGAAKILRQRSEIKFLFIGAGRQHLRLQQLIAQEKLTSFIFKPHQPREQLADTLAAANVHWVSLRPELEGLIVPSKLYGILAAARPVLSVCDEEGEVSSIVRQQGCGIAVRPGDSRALAKAITKLADDAVYRNEMGQRGRQASELLFARSSALAALSGIISATLEPDPAHHD